MNLVFFRCYIKLSNNSVLYIGYEPWTIQQKGNDPIIWNAFEMVVLQNKPGADFRKTMETYLDTANIDNCQQELYDFWVQWYNRMGGLSQREYFEIKKSLYELLAKVDGKLYFEYITLHTNCEPRHAFTAKEVREFLTRSLSKK